MSFLSFFFLIGRYTAFTLGRGIALDGYLYVWSHVVQLLPSSFFPDWFLGCVLFGLQDELDASGALECLEYGFCILWSIRI